MCGRYQLQASAEALASSHPNTSWRRDHASRYYPRQQFRPTNHAPVVIGTRQQNLSTAPNIEAEIVIMKWGMTPSWSKQQNRPPLINARRETLLQLPTFKNALKGKDGSLRCAVPTTGFYEWHKELGPGKPTLTPYLVRKPRTANVNKGDKTQAGDVTYMAGVYRHDSREEGENEDTFVIVTTEACKQFEWLHDRQPVFLSSEKDVQSWLDNGVAPEDAIAQLRTENGLSWTRMVKDLSEAAKGKAMVQRGLDSFFTKPSSTKQNKSSPQKARKTVRGPAPRTGAIRKSEKGSSKSARGKQKTLSSFFGT